MLYNKEETINDELEKKRSLLDAPRQIETPYRKEVDEFIDFLTGNKH